MLFNVVADIEIDGSPVSNFNSLSINQPFNDHHTFFIRLPFELIEEEFSLKNVKNFIGKVAIIRLKRGSGNSVLNEFKGIITDVGIEQFNSLNSQIILKGSSPTIILEGGDHTTCFIQKDLKKICDEATKDAASECKINISPVFKKQISYITQYKESNFEFLNRLSAEFGEWFFYNGKELFFGKPQKNNQIDLVLGEDVTGLQLRLQMLPMSYKLFMYDAGNDKVATFTTPAKIDAPGEFGKHMADESDKFFRPVNKPFVRPKPASPVELDSFLKLDKSGVASQFEIITGTSTNPEIGLGSVAAIVVSKRSANNVFSRREQGKYTITSITHELFKDGRYINTFDGLPANAEVIPVTNFKKPLAEPQTAIVKSNTDPDNLGRVKVQMPWQEQNVTTDFIRVMTPDGGIGEKNKKNRGFAFIPEVNDKVFVGFRFNDPDFPFVMGSFFVDNAAAGGGNGNKIKTLSTNKGSIVKFDDNNGSIQIADAGGNSILLNGGGLISLNSAEKIEFKCKDSSITMDKEGNIEIKGKVKIKLESDQDVSIKAKESIALKSDQEISLEANKRVDLKSNGFFAAKGTSDVKLESDANLSVKATANLALEGTAMAKLSSSGIAEIQGSLVKIN